MKDNFKIDLISQGSFVDRLKDPYTDKFDYYLVSTYTLKLNYTALDEYQRATMDNCRIFYEIDEEYQKFLKDKQKEMKKWQMKVKRELGININCKSVTIKQVTSEIFAVAHIEKIENE